MCLKKSTVILLVLPPAKAQARVRLVKTASTANIAKRMVALAAFVINQAQL
jgi:hypothetical protein